MSITFSFVRHAQSEVKAIANIIGGRSVETPLTEKGQKQATAQKLSFAIASII